MHDDDNARHAHDGYALLQYSSLGDCRRRRYRDTFYNKENRWQKREIFHSATTIGRQGGRLYRNIGEKELRGQLIDIQDRKVDMHPVIEMMKGWRKHEKKTDK